MTNAELLQQGISLMFAGIGFVMLFLLILIYAISLMSAIINRFFPEPIPVPTAPMQNDSSADLRPVIIAAIAHHRRQQGLK